MFREGGWGQIARRANLPSVWVSSQWSGWRFGWYIISELNPLMLQDVEEALRWLSPKPPWKYTSKGFSKLSFDALRFNNVFDRSLNRKTDLPSMEIREEKGLISLWQFPRDNDEKAKTHLRSKNWLAIPGSLVQSSSKEHELKNHG